MQNSVGDTTPELPQLLSIELRVLGAMMEKQLTTPDQYPLTLNSLMAACNQKTNRDPVSAHTQGDIARALTQLEHRKLARKEFGSRSEKFTQQLIKQLELGKKHQAILCVMMLRGPQTLSELHTRTQRMEAFSSKEELEHTLDRLCNRELPFVIRLEQQPGQREERFTHLLSGAHSGALSGAHNGAHSGALANTESVDTRAADETDEADSRLATTKPQQHTLSACAQELIVDTDPRAELEALQQQFDELKSETTSLKQQISQLYRLTGHGLSE